MLRFSLALFLISLPLSAQGSVPLGAARLLLARDNIASARAAASTLLEEAPNSSPVHEFAGEVDFREGKFTDAEAEFRKAIQLEPKLGRAWWGLARVFDCSSLHGVARRFFTRAYALEPRDPDILRSYAGTITGPKRVAVLEECLRMAGPQTDLKALENLRRTIEIEKKLEGVHTNHLVSRYEATQVHLEPLLNGLTHLYAVGLKVRINDAKPVTLLLDTGASGIVLGTKPAEKVAVSKLGDAQFGGIGDGGLKMGYVALADRVKIGNVELDNVVIHVGDRKSITDEDGLIGADVFSRFLVTLDFTGRHLRLEPQAGPGGEQEDPFTDRTITPQLKAFTPVYRIGHNLLIPTRLSGSRPVLFIIDSGASRSAISNRAAAEVTHVRTEDVLRMKGLSGNVNDMFTADKLVLQFAGFNQWNRNMLALDLDDISKAVGTEVSGFIGFPILTIFSSFTIDYRDGLVKFDYESN